jgi:glycyl-tRNA synthetase
MAACEANGNISLQHEGQDVFVEGKYLTFERKEKIVMEEKYVPHVIEPSFGLGRIMYCIFEHCFKIREKDASRTYFDFPA